MTYHKLTLTNIWNEKYSWIFSDIDCARKRFFEYKDQAIFDEKNYSAKVSVSEKFIIVSEIQIRYGLATLQTLNWSIELSENLGFDK